jgi:hypothetical protein
VLLVSPTCSFIHEADFILGLLARSINFTFRYIDDVLSLNSRFGDFVYRIYPIELELKDTTDTDIDRSSSYLDVHLEIESERRLRKKFTTKGMISIFPL